MDIINEKISFYRRLSDMTQRDLAEKMGLSTAAVSKWEQGASCPDIQLLPELAKIFDVSIDELFGGELVREPIYNFVDSVPWDDDGKIRIAVFVGKKLMAQSNYELKSGINSFDFRFDIPNRITGICKYTNNR